jgi:hypothetical protein
MDDDDYDIEYENKVRLFADILDSPILETDRSLIIRALTAARSSYLLAPISEGKHPDHSPAAVYQSVVRDRMIKKKVQLTKVSSLTHYEEAAISIVCQQTGLAEVKPLPIQFRFDIVRSLMEEPSDRRIEDSLVAAHKIYNQAMTGLLYLGDGPSPLIEIECRKLDPDAEKYYSAMRVCERIIHQRQSLGLQNKSGATAFQSLRPLDAELPRVSIATRGDIVVYKIGGEYYATSWDDFLCVRSIVTFRMNCLLLAALDESLPDDLAAKLKSMWEWQENCIFKYGNEGYELAKATESVFKARIMQISDGAFDDDSFSMMIEKQRKKEMNLSRSSSSPLVSDLEKLALSVVNIRTAAELFGALKFSGFPYIDPRRASKSSREHGTSKSRANFAEVMLMRDQFCDMVLRGYLAKHCKWPPMQFSHKSTKLKDLHKRGTLVFGATEYPLTDWHYCRFLKFMEFDYHLDYLDMMDDKSLGLESEDAWKAWNELKAANYTEATIPATRHKKLIVRLLSIPEFDPRKIVAEIRNANLKKEDICLALYPKEKEFKLEARLFVMLQFSYRYYLTLCEKNVKEVMKKYLDDQSMTKGRKGTMQYLEKMSLARRDGEVDTVFIEVDLTRWNLEWKGVVVDPVSRIFNDMYGMKGVFSKGHAIFENATMVVRIPDDRPDGVLPFSRPREWPQGDYIWRNHIGGLEGIIQGQWTECTQAEVRLIMRDLPILSYTLLGQGDNQILAVTYQRDSTLTAIEDMKRVSDLVTSALERRFALVNQIVKPEECLVSRTVVTYSKIIWVNGCQIPTTLKHAGTVAPVGASYLPSYTVGLEAISSACRASADAFTNPSRAYLYFLTLYRDFADRARNTLPSSSGLLLNPLSQKELDILCVLPGDLGGLPTQSPFDFLYGGVSDHLSASIATLVAFAEIEPFYGSYLGYLESDEPWKASPNPAALLKDPFSVPIERAIGADSRIQAALASVLSYSAANKDIRPILSTSVEIFDKELSAFLTRTRPFYPLLMADIRELSIIGVREKIEKKFIGTRTVQDLIRGRAPINYRQTVITSDTKRLDSFFKFIRSANTRKLSRPRKSTFQIAEGYRNRWFGAPGVLKGVTTLHPSCASVDYGLQRVSSDYIEFIVMDTGDKAVQTRGEFGGRWGDRTWEHRKASGVTVIGTERSVLATKRLLLLESQLAAGGSLRDMIRTVVRQRTPIAPDLLTMFMPTVIGGIGPHRWDSTIEDKAFAWLGPIMVTQHTSVQTDTMTTLSGGTRDFAFCFQEHIFYGLQIARTLAEERPAERHAFRLHYSIGPDAELFSDPVSAPEFQIRTPPPADGNPLVSVGSLLFESLSDRLPPRIAPVVKLENLGNRRDRVGLMTHYFLEALENPRLLEAVQTGGLPPAGLSLDVGTVLGVGMQDLVLSAGAAVALRSLEHSLSHPDWRPGPRWQVGLERFAEAAAAPLVRFANAPGVRDQPWVRKSGILLHPGLGGYKNVSVGLTVQVRKAALQAVERLPDIAPFPLVLSQNAERATPSRVLHCLVALLVVIESEGDFRRARTVYRKQLSVIRTVMQEVKRIETGIGLIELLAHDEFDAAPFARAILNGNFVRQVEESFDDVTRYMRKFVRPSAAPDGVELVKVRQKSRALPITRSVFRGSPVAYPRVDEPRLNQAVRLVERNMIECWSESTISRDSLPFLSTLRGVIDRATVGLIGVGRGAMARDLFALGAHKVIGVDLLSDFPRLSTVGSSYTPPEVPPTSRPFAWQWCSAVFQFGGDWFDQRTIGVLSLEAPSLVVVDIQTGLREAAMKIDPLVKFGYKGYAAFREVLYPAELNETCSFLRSVGSDVRVYKGRGAVTPSEYWFSVKLEGNTEWGKCANEEILPIPLRRMGASPSEFWYPDWSGTFVDLLIKGRAQTNKYPVHTVCEELLQRLAPERPGDTLNARERREVFFSLAVLHTLRVSRTADIKETIMNIASAAAAPPPGVVLGVIGDVDPKEWYRVLTRVVPRVLHLFPSPE